jgi:potassium efflux system protein
MKESPLDEMIKSLDSQEKTKYATEGYNGEILGYRGVDPMTKIISNRWLLCVVLLCPFFFLGDGAGAQSTKDLLLSYGKNKAEESFKQAEIAMRTEALSTKVSAENMSGTQKTAQVLKQGLSGVKGELWKIWDFQVWVIDNRPVTIRKLVVTLIILIAGLLIAKYLLRAVGRRLLLRSQLKESTASAIQKLFTYFAYLLILVFALRIVNIPLEAFAFLGGAVAIGIGFGAQNLINNFISGFILMGERPISIGDIIEVESVLGKVEEVGARCTRIRTGENIHILVPNSAFLEKNITNWTLSDQKIRAHVTVGVVYGSPVQEVERLLLRAVVENEKVLKEPGPFVLFTDFGDNALAFQVHFWITVRRIIERRLIESSVRFHIDELFREAGIIIAFPQRDVHLDAKEPLEVVLTDKKG